MTKDEALDLALDALKNVAVTGPDDDGLVWINLPGNGTTGKAILRVGKSGLIAAQCAKLYEEQRTKAITAIKQALAAPVQEPVHQWRQKHSPYWYDGYPDNDDGGGPYETRTLYTTPPAAHPAVPDAMRIANRESPDYREGWNDCRQAMLRHN